MNAASQEPTLPRSVMSGPAAAVVVALAGAGLVVVGLLLVGVREARGALWMPASVPVVQTS